MPEICPLVENPSPVVDRPPDLGLGVWRSAVALKPMLLGGAVLRICPDGRGLVLEAPTGAELARATRTSELAALLNGIAGKVPKRARVILSIGKLLPAAAQVRFTGESLGGMIREALRAEIERRQAQIADDLRDLDAAAVLS